MTAEDLGVLSGRAPAPGRPGSAPPPAPAPAVPDGRRSAVATMLGARSVAVVGASPRPGSFGQRMVIEALRSPQVRVRLVNPRHPSIEGLPCLPSLADLDEPADLALLGVGDHALEQQLLDAAAAGVRSAVIFGSAHLPGLRERVRQIADDAGMAVCGAGCMGFVNAGTGLRALGYLERAPLRAGPIALVTHSGSVFSTMLRTRRAIGVSCAVSSGQELVTSTADYLEHALDERDAGTGSTGILALVLETIRDPQKLRAQLRRAAASDVPVVILPVGGSAAGSRLVAAHSGAVAGAGATWEALCGDTGAVQVRDLAEFADTLELLSLARRPRGSRPARGPGAGIATVHDSGAERALTADLADEVGVPFATIAAGTTSRLAALLDEGLVAENPLDLWGTGADTRALFRDCLLAMAEDPSVAVTALAVDLVPEFDRDTSYPDAVLDAATAAAGPVVVLTGLPSAMDEVTAARLRGAGVAVLEGTRSGLVALRNLLRLGDFLPADLEDPAVSLGPTVTGPARARRERWRARLGDPVPLGAAGSFALLTDYGVPCAAVLPAADEDAAVLAATRIGYPVVLKTDAPGVAHKSDGGGVLLGVGDEASVRRGYARLATRFGPEVIVAAAAAPGVEVSAGFVRDPHLGPLLVLAAGGTLIELIADRVVALPPVSPPTARQLIGRLRISALLNGFRGGRPADIEALALAVAGLSDLAADLGDLIEALDVNPIIVSSSGAVAVDVLLQR